MVASRTNPACPGPPHEHATELNIGSSLDGINDFFRLPKAGFAAAKAALRAASGGDAVTASYHAGLVGPFCMAATRDWFQSILSR